MTVAVHVSIPESIRVLKPKLISQGAEALVFIATGSDGKRFIVKYRLEKRWRVSELDAMVRRRRTNQEARVLTKLPSAGVRCPNLLYVNAKHGVIYMELIHGATLKQVTSNSQFDEVDMLYRQLGRMIGRMHHLRIVHGDLTTSNVMVQPSRDLCLIDFGLSSQDASVEDKAVDLYVLERAIESTHSEVAGELMESLLAEYRDEGYAVGDPRIDQVISRLAVVRQRGRKRTTAG